MKRGKIIGLAVLVLLLLTLVWQNRSPVETKFLFQTFTMPGALLIFLTGAVGFCSGVLTCMLLYRRSNKPPQLENEQPAEVESADQ